MARGLKGVTTEFPPTNREDVPRIITTPVVERPPPAVKRHVDLVVVDVTNRGGADKLWVLVIDCLQLCALLECVCWGGRWGLYAHKYNIIDILHT